MAVIDSDSGGARHGPPWRVLGWGVAGTVLLLPLLAGAPWTGSDYVVMAFLLGGAGLLLELAVHASGDRLYCAGAGVAVVAGFLLLWVNGAVGFLGDEDNPANLMFLGVLAIALAGVFVANFRPAGMARAMLATAAAQVLVGVVALVAGLGSPGYAGLYEVVLGTSLFGGLWLISATLLRKAAGRAEIFIQE